MDGPPPSPQKTITIPQWRKESATMLFWIMSIPVKVQHTTYARNSTVTLRYAKMKLETKTRPLRVSRKRSNSAKKNNTTTSKHDRSRKGVKAFQERIRKKKKKTQRKEARGTIKLCPPAPQDIHVLSPVQHYCNTFAIIPDNGADATFTLRCFK